MTVTRYAKEVDVYIPKHFVPDDDSVRDLLMRQGVADLITMTEHGLLATPLPFGYDPEVGERGALNGHLARGNDQWRHAVTGEALAIVRGPDAYVTPSWYATKAEHHRVVPTWDYVTAHVYGELIVHDDPVWTERQIRSLTDRHEAENAEPWSVDQAPAQFIERMLRGIVGIELVITRIEASFKLSQNQPSENIDGVIAGLETRGHANDGAVATAVRAHTGRS